MLLQDLKINIINPELFSFTATPWNLLTVDRKIPFTEVCFNTKTNEFKICTDEDGNKIAKAITDTKKFGPQYPLNHVMWCSGLEIKLREGFFTKLAMFYPDEEPMFWSFSSDKSNIFLNF